MTASGNIRDRDAVVTEVASEDVALYLEILSATLRRQILKSNTVFFIELHVYKHIGEV